jgi:SAM-dependent methyltransferase
MHTALKSLAHPQISLEEFLLAGYYRFFFGRNLRVAALLGARIALLERHQGRPDIPLAREAWEARYAAADLESAPGFQEQARYEVIAGYVQRLKPGAAVLDVGCGKGLLLEKLACVRCSTYLGIDISQKAIDDAAAWGGADNFAQADAQSFVSESRFDVIVFNEVLYHLEEPLRQVERYRLYLKSGGIFITSLLEQSARAVAISRWLRRHYETILALKMSGRSKTWMIDVFAPGAVAPGAGREGICP